VDLSAFVADVGADGPVTIAGQSTRGGAVTGQRCVAAPSGIDWIQADEMTVCCGAGTPIDVLDAALAEHGQRTVLPTGGTVGGALALGRSGSRRLGDGPMRDALLQARYANADGALVKAGGPTVKNVSGFDVCRLLVGSRGTLGFLGEVILRTRPIARHSQWFVVDTDDPAGLFTALYRPVSVLWDGATVWALLEGHPGDVQTQAADRGLTAVDAPPRLPPARTLVAPGEQLSIGRRLPVGSFVAELGVGVMHMAEASAPKSADPHVRTVQSRVKHQFDPVGRLNPGVVVG
jgi:FAD/FMN-containing dehydrogenase